MKNKEKFSICYTVSTSKKTVDIPGGCDSCLSRETGESTKSYTLAILIKFERDIQSYSFGSLQEKTGF